MPIPNSDNTADPDVSRIRDRGTPSGTGRLEELHAHTVRLRDLYKNARWQTADLQFRDLRLLFDNHYKEQLRLVDVLTDRIRLLAGADRVFAGVFLQGTQFSYALRGRASPMRLLRDLFDAHEMVLSAAESGAKGHAREHGAYDRDFAVGQVVIVNDLQGRSIAEELMRRDNSRRFLEA
jgi:DNA-binding ferritin-like protein